jgi:hypothetical protein
MRHLPARVFHAAKRVGTTPASLLLCQALLLKSLWRPRRDPFPSEQPIRGGRKPNTAGP